MAITKRPRITYIHGGIEISQLLKLFCALKMAELFSKLAFFDPFPKKFSVFTNYSGETNSLFVQFLV